MKKWPGVKIRIGEGAQIDEDVILGYPSGRLAAGGRVVIGPQACIRSGTIIYQSVTIGSHFQTGHHVIIREENQIGDHVCIWGNTTVDYGCRIGSRVKLHTGIYVAQFSVIEDDVFVAPGVIFANDKYPVSHHLQGPRLEKGAKIGVHVTILPGVCIGAGALVGAGSVVTKDVPKDKLVVGNPARVVGTVQELDQKKERHVGIKSQGF